MAILQASGTTPSQDTMTLRNWLAVLTMAAGTFTVVTVENLPVGLLTTIGDGLRATNSMVALMVTVSGLVAAATAPVLPLIIRRLDRKTVVAGLLLLMIVANILTAMAPSISFMLMARILAGISIGGFWALAAGLAVRLVPDAYVGKATSLIFMGAMAANVLGVPIGTSIGNQTSWQTAFLAISGFGMLVVAAILTWVPKIPAAEPVRIHTLLEQLRNRNVRAGVLTTFLLVSGHFGAFTFISPLLQDFAHIDVKATAILLFVFGGAAIIGNFAAGALAGRSVHRAIIIVSILLEACLLIFPLVGGAPVGAILLLVVWGLTYGGLPVAVQTWIFKKAPNIEAATGLNTAMFNLAIAFGALYGGVAMRIVGLPSALWIAAVPVALAVAVMATTRQNS